MVIPTDAVVETIAYKDAAEFVDALSLRGEVFSTFGAVNSWIFRGHSNDETYRLIPTALRSDGKLSKLVGQAINTLRDQFVAEFKILREFFRECDRNGLSLPEDSQELREFFASEPYDSDKWPNRKILSLMALAQHCGLPTRLLDWSWNPLKAAYFATLEDLTPDGNLSVWALDRRYVGTFRSTTTVGTPLTPFALVTAPTASNSNLRAQEGLFTVFHPVEPIVARHTLESDRSSYDEAVFQWLADFGVSTGPWFKRLTLPRRERRDLRRELEREGVTYATLFPDYAGAAKSILRRPEIYQSAVV